MSRNMSRPKPKRVKPPKRIRYKDKPFIIRPGPALLKLLAEKGVELGTPEAEAVMVEALTAALGEGKC